MSLSTFQRAVLQEMGIPVWVSQTSLQDEDTNSVPTDVANKRSVNASFEAGHTHSSSMPSNEEKQSRLAQLRAQVSSDSTKTSGQSKNAQQNISAPPLGQKAPISHSVPNAVSKNSLASEPSAMSGSSSSPIPIDTPNTVELTQVQRLQGKQWLQDLDVALAYLQLPFTSTQVKIGQDIAVTNGGIVIPSAPHLLTAAMQKQLWKMLCALSNSVSTPEAR